MTKMMVYIHLLTQEKENTQLPSNTVSNPAQRGPNQLGYAKVIQSHNLIMVNGSADIKETEDRDGRQ